MATVRGGRISRKELFIQKSEVLTQQGLKPSNLMRYVPAAKSAFVVPNFETKRGYFSEALTKDT